MEIERHEVTHIPPMPWCLACRLGNGRDASHFRSLAVREAAQIQIDFCFLREDAAAYDVAEPVPENPGRQFCVLLTWRHRTPWQLRCQRKNAELEYAIGQPISFIKKARASSTRTNTSIQLSVLGCSGEHEVTVAETSANSQNRSRDEDQVTPSHEHGSLALAG